MNQTLYSLLIFLAGMGFGLIIKSISDMLIRKRLKQLMKASDSEKRQEMIFFGVANGMIWWMMLTQYGFNLQAITSMF
ncbi:MAG: hypothetical protein PWP16_1009 [Eubacteriaceae bacterium]|jgi:Trk-type K+ transport system membrane component|nr:hypothetical protein [Eubacteriaceae bacterium]MDK2904008.1 hypothetical protein [Eubacteriaceae bacterium]MDK2936604.1 hypothetical protein [Eubacteriaceae bacterium]MDK2961054.1 hypothetical protein [Eubacteriaceae bacterium]MDN5307646.1 hypothetical protein [Eubacteriaceae bacterium]